MEDEAVAYEALGADSSLTALFDILPAWCLQNRIELVSGAWWDDCAVMNAIIDTLHARFVELDFGGAVCDYFLESCYEALDAYHRDLSSEPCPWSEFSVPELIAVIREERERQPQLRNRRVRQQPARVAHQQRAAHLEHLGAAPCTARRARGPCWSIRPTCWPVRVTPAKPTSSPSWPRRRFCATPPIASRRRPTRSTPPSRACRPICATPPSPTSAASTASWKRSATKCCPQAAATPSGA